MGVPEFVEDVFARRVKHAGLAPKEASGRHCWKQCSDEEFLLQTKRANMGVEVEVEA